jgi:LUD domain
MNESPDRGEPDARCIAELVGRGSGWRRPMCWPTSSSRGGTTEPPWSGCPFPQVPQAIVEALTANGAASAVLPTGVSGSGSDSDSGTIALDHSLDRGRRALSLLPDTHVCLVREEQVVSDVPEGVHGPRQLWATIAGS